MPAEANRLAILDGELMLASEARIPATDDGLLRGDGAFEGIRFYDGVPFRLEDHLRRMQRSCAALRLNADIDVLRADVAQIVAAVSAATDRSPHQVLRIVVTRGGHRLLLTEPLPHLPARARLLAVTHAVPPLLAGVKSLSYGANMLGTRLAQEAGYDEALFVSAGAREVLEAPRSAVFWAFGETLETTPLSEPILASITRAVIIELTGATERTVTLDELKRADEVFIASSAREVLPVGVLDEHTYSGTDTLTRRVQALFDAHIRETVGVAAPAR